MVLKKILQLKKKGNCTVKDIISLDATTTLLPTPLTSFSRYPRSSLVLSDMKILLEGKWLNDNIINKGQRLIKQEYPHVEGFQDVALAHTMGFSVEPGEFVQVLYAVGHWVTISTIGCDPAEVDVFYSGGRVLNNKLRQQIAALLCTSHDVITVKCFNQRPLVYHNVVNALPQVQALSAPSWW